MSEHDPDTASEFYLRLGGLLGPQLLRRELEDLQVADARSAVDLMLEQAVERLTALSQNDVDELTSSLHGAIPRLIEALPNYAAIVDRVTEIAERAAYGHAGGDDRGQRLSTATACVAVLLIVAKSHFGVDWTDGRLQHLSAGLDSGIPAGFVEVAGVLATLVAGKVSAGGGKTSTEAEEGHGSALHHAVDEALPSEGAEGGEVDGQISSPDQGPDEAGTPALPVANVGGGPSNPLLRLGLNLEQLPKGRLPYSEAVHARDRVLEKIRGKENDLLHVMLKELGYSNVKSGRLYNNFDRLFNKKPAGYLSSGRIDWPFPTEITIGAGLLVVPPNREGRGSDGEAGFRIALRLQSKFELKAAAVEWFAEQIHRITDVLSVRWISPITLLDSRNWDGNFRPWKGPIPPNGKLLSGAPLNIAGGGASSCTLILSTGEGLRALTAGHALRRRSDGFILKPNTYVFAQPQPVAYNPDAKVGKIFDGSVFDEVDYSQSQANGGGSLDYALIDLDPGVADLHGKPNLVDGRVVDSEIYEIPLSPESPAPPDEFFELTVTKSAAKTASLTGRLNAIGLSIDMIDTVTGYAVEGRNLVEMTVNSGAKGFPQPGDSGALLSVPDSMYKPRPLAMLVGAQRAGRILKTGSNDKKTTSIYGVPLCAIEPLRGMKVV